MLDLRYRSILAMAIPLMGSTFIQSVVMITDSSFLSRYSTVAFDAAGNGGLIYITLYIALVGMSDGSQILMARRIGQKKENLLARIFGTSIATNLFLVLLLFALIELLIPDLIRGYTTHADIAQGQIEFLSIRGYAMFFGAISLAINAYFFALGRTLVVFLSAIVVACSNIWLDYLLIFGNGGFPMLGLKGAAWASTIADGAGMLFLCIVLYYSKSAKKHQLFSQLKFNIISMKELLKLGSPIMLQGIIALSTWTVFFAWIEQTGKHELTVSQNIRSLYFLAFIPVWGFGATTKTYISQYIGKGDFDSLKIIIRRIQFLTIAFLLLFFHGAILYPEKMISMINPNIEYMEDSVAILRYITGSIFIYGIGSVYFQTINGSGNTRFTFFVELLSVGIYLIVAYLLIKVYQVDIFWIWSVEYVYFASMLLFSVAYLTFFNWHKKQI